MRTFTRLKAVLTQALPFIGLQAAACLGALLLVPQQGFATPPTYTLNELLERGLARNESYQISIENLHQVREVRQRAKGTFLPTLNVLGSYFRQDEPETSLARNVSPSVQRNWRLTANQPLFQGGSEYAYLAQTGRALEAAESSVVAARANLFLQLTDLYFEILLRQSVLQRVRNEVQLYEDQVKELRGRVRVGRTRASDLLTVEAAAAQLEAGMKTIESEHFRLRTQLASLIGIETEFELKEEGPGTKAALRPLSEYIEAIPAAPAVRAAMLQREAEEKSISIARGAHLPALGLAGNYYLHREGLTRDTKWDVLATLTIPIFNGGRTQSAVREAASRYRVAELEAGRLLRETRVEVESLHQSVSAADAELKALQNARDLAERSRNRIARDYRYGLSNNLELIQAMRTLEETENAYDRVRLTRMKDRLRLDVAAGLLPAIP